MNMCNMLLKESQHLSPAMMTKQMSTYSEEQRRKFYGVETEKKYIWNLIGSS